MSKKLLIHTRTISINTYETGENSLLVEGTLTDDRLFPSYFYSAQKYIDPASIHHIIVELAIQLPSLLIVKADVRMEAVPNDICFEIKDCIKKLEGLQIRRGFTPQVRQLIGGAKGCLHMTNLVLAMGSAAVQGQWSYYSRKRKDVDYKIPEIDLSILRNCCWLWREGSHYWQRIDEMEKEQKN